MNDKEIIEEINLIKENIAFLNKRINGKRLDINDNKEDIISLKGSIERMEYKIETIEDKIEELINDLIECDIKIEKIKEPEDTKYFKFEHRVNRYIQDNNKSVNKLFKDISRISVLLKDISFKKSL